jgi:methionine-R-sulfoxide reductase
MAERVLTPEQHRVLRGHGTEPRGSSPLNKEKRAGTFRCAGCGEPLFSSDTKFESGTGWPSFWAPLQKDAVATTEDQSYGMTRVSRRSAADRVAVLHERDRFGVRTTEAGVTPSHYCGGQKHKGHKGHKEEYGLAFVSIVSFV